MKKEYATPPYSDAMKKVCQNIEKTIDKIKEGKPEEQGNKDVQSYFNETIKITTIEA